MAVLLLLLVILKMPLNPLVLFQQIIPDDCTETNDNKIRNNFNLYFNLDSRNQLNTQKDNLSDNLIIIGLNCQSIKNKKEVSWELLANYSLEIVVACETWLDQSIKDNEIISTSYKLYCHDRSNGYGGVFIAVNSAISFQLLQLCDSCELCAVKLLLPTNQSLIVIGACTGHQIEIYLMQKIYAAPCLKASKFIYLLFRRFQSPRYRLEY